MKQLCAHQQHFEGFLNYRVQEKLVKEITHDPKQQRQACMLYELCEWCLMCVRDMGKARHVSSFHEKNCSMLEKHMFFPVILLDNSEPEGLYSQACTWIHMGPWTITLRGWSE